MNTKSYLINTTKITTNRCFANKSIYEFEQSKIYYYYNNLIRDDRHGSTGRDPAPQD